MASQDFSPEESLLLIKNMIDKTRKGFSNQSGYFLLWGWCTMLALLGQFVLKHFFHWRHHYMVWLITIVCAIITIVWVGRDRRKRAVRTYVKDSMVYLWTGLGITFFIFSLLFIKLGWFNCYPFYMTLYGVGTFVSGKILQFNPLVIGGIGCWILAAIAIWFSMDAQMLFAAASILISYIIPGHLIQLKYRNQS